MFPERRTSVSRWASRCASRIGNGISSGVSSVAYPNIRPWSPAPWAARRSSLSASTPRAMSGDWAPMETDTPQEAPSKPFADAS
ncbi:hypothetical protein HEK131_27010 [Streptomyces seoulensis]|nr:hypothetical protein HEK131_27010 [Streptomyces seoulensis]